MFASERGWKNAIVSGGTPKPDVWCHCLVPEGGCGVATPVSVPLWDVDHIQFPRLIAEAECAGLFDTANERYRALLDEMGLTGAEFSELVDRAQRTWDALKEKHLSGIDISTTTKP